MPVFKDVKNQEAMNDDKTYQSKSCALFCFVKDNYVRADELCSENQVQNSIKLSQLSKYQQ